MNKKKFYKLMPHHDGRRFANEHGETFDNVFGHTVLMLLHLLKNYNSRKPHDKQQWVKSSTPPKRSQELTITWIGHASFLIQVNQCNILIDPIFGNSSCLFPRILPPGLTVEQLPPIDYILLSHNHRDHMDRKSLATVVKNNPKAHILVPHGDKDWFRRYGYNLDLVSEFNWWKNVSFLDINFTFLPAYHWSQRGILDRNKSLWGSWMLDVAGKKIYFGGDTAYWKHFKEISNEFPIIDVAFMPIGPCEPRNWMEKAHLSPEQAGRAFIEINAKHFIPMHWGTFFFGIDYYEQPIERLLAWWNENKAQLQDRKLHLYKMGQQFKPEQFLDSLSSQRIQLLEI